MFQLKHENFRQLIGMIIMKIHNTMSWKNGFIGKQYSDSKTEIVCNFCLDSKAFEYVEHDMNTIIFLEYYKATLEDTFFILRTIALPINFTYI